MLPGSTPTSGTSTPTRSCLKHSHHHQHTLDAACCSSRKRPGVKPQLVTKSVSFDGHEPQHVYVADYDYDRQSVPVAAKLSYEDLLELKMLKIHMMCPRNNQHCNIVPVGILPLLPPSNPPSPAANSPTAPSHDKPNNMSLHLTPPPSSSDDDQSDSSSPLVFRSSLDSNDPTSPSSPSTPKRRSLSPVRTRKVVHQTSPIQFLARDVPASTELLSSLAPLATGPPILPTFQIGPSTHRSALGPDPEFDSDHCHQCTTPSKRDSRKPSKPDEQDSGEDADDDDDAVVVPPPFAPPPCPYIQPSSALLSQPLASFSLAQPTQFTQLALPKVPLLPLLPLLPTPPSSSPTTPHQSTNSSPQNQSPTHSPSLVPMQITLPPVELVGVPSPGLIPPSPFSLYPTEVTNPSPSRANSRSDSSQQLLGAGGKHMQQQRQRGQSPTVAS